MGYAAKSISVTYLTFPSLSKSNASMFFFLLLKDHNVFTVIGQLDAVLITADLTAVYIF